MTSSQLAAQAGECARTRALLGRAEDIIADVVDALHAAGLDDTASHVLGTLECLRLDRDILRTRFHLLRAKAATLANQPALRVIDGG